MDFDGSSLTINFHSKPTQLVSKRECTNSSSAPLSYKPTQHNKESRKRKYQITTNNLSKVSINSNNKYNLFDLQKQRKGELYNHTKQSSTHPTGYRPLFNAIKEAEKLALNTPKNKNEKLETLDFNLFDKNADLDSFQDVDERLRIALNSHIKSNHLTIVQKLSWPTIVKRENTLIKSPSGSGKTLAFLVPILDRLIKKDPKISRQDGVFALILVPTKELAKQISDILTRICRNFVWIVPGGLYGCDKRKAEKSRLRKGLNIVVATPGRLHDHLVHTKCLDLSNLECFIVDEADLLLDMGYEKKFQEIKECIPLKVLNECQKIFLSATLSKKFISFFSQIFRGNIYFVDASKETVTLQQNISDVRTNAKAENNEGELEIESDSVLPNSIEFDYPINLKQTIIEIPTKLRLIALVWTLKYIVSLKNSITGNNIRVIIFFSSMASADFHCQLFQALNQHLSSSSLQINLKYLLLHGSMEIKERINVYETFSNYDQCILFTTDVAARGLDFPCVDWIIQFNPAREIKEYVHRVGRTCRIGNCGNALLFLEPNEMSYADLLYKSRVSIEQLNIYTLYQKISKKEKNLENDATTLFHAIREVVSSEELSLLALKAYNSAIRAYTSYPRALKQIFCLKNLHQGHLAESFVIREKPTDISKRLLPKYDKPNDNFQIRKNFKLATKMNHYKVQIPKVIPKNSIRSASSLLLDEFQGGVISGSITRKFKK